MNVLSATCSLDSTVLVIRTHRESYSTFSVLLRSLVCSLFHFCPVVRIYWGYERMSVFLAIIMVEIVSITFKKKLLAMGAGEKPYE